MLIEHLKSNLEGEYTLTCVKSYYFSQKLLFVHHLTSIHLPERGLYTLSNYCTEKFLTFTLGVI